MKQITAYLIAVSMVCIIAMQGCTWNEIRYGYGAVKRAVIVVRTVGDAVDIVAGEVDKKVKEDGEIEKGDVE